MDLGLQMAKERRSDGSAVDEGRVTPLLPRIRNCGAVTSNGVRMQLPLFKQIKEEVCHSGDWTCQWVQSLELTTVVEGGPLLIVDRISGSPNT